MNTYFLALSLQWIKIGGITGLLSIIAYALAAFAPLPDFWVYLTAFAFGPLLSIAFIGVYHALALHKNSALIQIGTLFAIAGGMMVLLMLCVQQAIFVNLDNIKISTNPNPSELSKGLNSVHLGMDVAWDVLISAATILLAIAMLRHPRFGMIVGGIGIILGSLLLGFNLYYFPTPPANAASIDWGPFVALWFAWVFVLLLRSIKWAKEKTA